MALPRTIPRPRVFRFVSAASRALPPGPIEVVPVRAAAALLIVAVSLTLASLAGQFVKYYLGHDYVFGLINKFNLSHEGNIPTWYSSVTLLVCAVLLWTIGRHTRVERDRYSRHWSALALLFLYLSIDEGAAIHEMINRPLRDALGTHGFLYYPAALVGAIFAAIVGSAYVSFLRSLHARSRLLFVASAAVYLSGALVIEAFSARHAELFGQQNMTYAAITTLEELCEMLGVVIFVYALLSYMALHIPQVLVCPRFTEPPAAGHPH